MKPASIQFALAALLLLFASATSAAFVNLGDTINLDVTGGTLSTNIFVPPPDATNKSTAVIAGPEYVVCVDGGADCSSGGLKITIDVSDQQVSFLLLGTTAGPGSFVLTLSDLDWIPAATIVDVTQPGTLLTAGTFVWNSFGGDNIVFLGQDNGDGRVAYEGTIVFDLTLEPVGNVPEPGILVLLGLGLSGMVLVRRRIAR